MFTELTRVTVWPESHIQRLGVRKIKSDLGSATLIVDLGELLGLTEPHSLTIK